MSYILEALRRAERERNPAQAQDLRIVTDSRGTHIATRKPPWPWMIGGLALAFVLGALLMTQLLKPSMPVPAAPAAPNVVATIPAPAAPPPVAVVEDESSLSTLDDLVEPTTEEPLADTFTATEPLDISEQAALAEVEEQAEIAPTYSEVHELEVEQIDLAPANRPQVQELKDMPPEYRADFPKLTLDVHFHDEDSSRRFVMINGKRYREGDSLSEGPQITEITQTGAILNYRGQDVLLSAAP